MNPSQEDMDNLFAEEGKSDAKEAEETGEI